VDLYEFQGKELFRHYGIPASEGRLAETPAEARAGAEELGGQVVVKAQVLTGGRGKAGGVKLADDPQDAERKAEEIIGLDINGHVVRKLWIERASEIFKEYYLSVTFDRGEKKVLFMLTTEGGIEIEQVADETPEKLARLHVDPLEGYQPYQARHLIYGAGIVDPNEQKQVLDIIGKLYECFVGSDAMLCEINPLIVTPSGEVRALDSKFTVDDNALYKHPDVEAMRDPEAYPPEERAAREKDVTYVKLDGEVGILGNGAGLVMSTLDTIALAGGRPANFCDLGGGSELDTTTARLPMNADANLHFVFTKLKGWLARRRNGAGCQSHTHAAALIIHLARQLRDLPQRCARRLRPRACRGPQIACASRSIISPRASMPEARQNNSKLAEIFDRASSFSALVGIAVDVVSLFMALLSFVESSPRA